MTYICFPHTIPHLPFVLSFQSLFIKLLHEFPGTLHKFLSWVLPLTTLLSLVACLLAIPSYAVMLSISEFWDCWCCISTAPNFSMPFFMYPCLFLSLWVLLISIHSHVFLLILNPKCNASCYHLKTISFIACFQIARYWGM